MTAAGTYGVQSPGSKLTVWPSPAAATSTQPQLSPRRGTCGSDCAASLVSAHFLNLILWDPQSPLHTTPHPLPSSSNVTLSLVKLRLSKRYPLPSHPKSMSTLTSAQPPLSFWTKRAGASPLLCKKPTPPSVLWSHSPPAHQLLSYVFIF